MISIDILFLLWEILISFGAKTTRAHFKCITGTLQDSWIKKGLNRLHEKIERLDDRANSWSSPCFLTHVELEDPDGKRNGNKIDALNPLPVCNWIKLITLIDLESGLALLWQRAAYHLQLIVESSTFRWNFIKRIQLRATVCQRLKATESFTSVRKLRCSAVFLSTICQ